MYMLTDDALLFCNIYFIIFMFIYAVFSLIRGAYVVKVIIISIKLNEINSFFKIISIYH